MGEAISAALAAAGNGLMSAGVATGLIEDVRARLGFTIAVPSPEALAPPGRIDDRMAGEDYWFERPDAGLQGRIARVLMNAAAAPCAPFAQSLPERDHAQIGRASCRERVCQYG